MANVRMDLREVIRHFEQLEDPRSPVNRLHPLTSVLVIAIMAVLAGANGPTAIAQWAKSRTYVQMPAPKSLPGFKNWKGLLSIGIDSCGRGVIQSSIGVKRGRSKARRQ